VTEAAGGDLARALSQVALSLEAERTGGERSTGDMVHAIARAAVTTVPGAECATVSLVRRRHGIQTLARTEGARLEVDRLQERTREGPYADAIWHRPTYRVDDLVADSRCPTFGPRVARLGSRSLLSLRLLRVSDRITALSLFARRPGSFDDRSELVGLLFAAHAAVALASWQREDQLREAIRSRDVIGQAKGMLMERHSISHERAFLMLTRASQATNIRVREIAENLVRDHPVRAGSHPTPADRGAGTGAAAVARGAPLRGAP